jgi:hypothetical protein
MLFAYFNPMVFSLFSESLIVFGLYHFMLDMMDGRLESLFDFPLISTLGLEQIFYPAFHGLQRLFQFTESWH